MTDDLRISKLFILYDSERNPFRSLLTYALDDATLRMAILAVAARHFANSGHSFEQWNDALAHRFVNADWDALHFKMRAIKLLSSSLSCPGSSQKRTILLATILFMIFLDILESGIDGWQYHLHGAKSLVNLSRSLLEVGAKDNFSSCPDVVVEDTERFVGQQFALYAFPALAHFLRRFILFFSSYALWVVTNNSSVSTIGGALSGSDDSTPDFFQFDENRHQESIIRSFLGCPGFLLRAIHFFSVQRHLVGSLQLHDDLTIYEHIRNTSTMLELTAKFNCHRRALESVQLRVPSEVQIEELTLLLQAFKIATMLYGNRILHAFKTHLGIITPDNHELVLQLLSTIDSLKSNATFFKCLLWPIFIVGLESQVASEHELVVEFLKRIWNLTCCVNVINASKILRDSWKHVHLGSSLAPGTAIPVIETGWLLVWPGTFQGWDLGRAVWYVSFTTTIS